MDNVDYRVQKPGERPGVSAVQKGSGKGILYIHYLHLEEILAAHTFLPSFGSFRFSVPCIMREGWRPVEFR